LSTALIAVLVAALAVPAFAGSTVHGYKVGPGTKLRTIRMPKYPDEIRVSVLRQGTSVPDIQPADPAYPMWSHTSSMSAAAGAIVGVNGDFGTSKGQPKHTLMIDGELWTTGQSGGNAIAWSANGKRAFVGHPALKILGHDVNTGASFYIPEWNVGPPPAGGIGAYTARGGTVTRPPGVQSSTASDPRWCAARLEPSAGIRWNSPKRTSLVRPYKVTVQQEPCPKTKLPLGTAAGAVVIASRFQSGTPNKVKKLEVGDTVKLRWTFKGWPGVTDVMGAQQMLVHKGTNVAPAYTSGSHHILDFNPRSAAGITRGCLDADNSTTCKMILITVDGRQASTNWSKGVRLPFLAKLLLHQGAWMAVNLDGGGSTTTWAKNKGVYCQSTPDVGGCLVNRPSQSSGERSTRSAIVILPSADGGTPQALR
jgi:hypothetical protein